MVLLILALLVTAQEPVTEECLKNLVERLASDDLEARDKAQADLYALGLDIKSRLEKHLAAATGESANRIRAVLNRLESDKYFKDLVPAVATLSLDRKRRTPEEIFALVKEKTGWNIRASAMNVREPVELGWTDAPVLQVVDDVCRALGRGKVTLRVLAGGQGHERNHDMHGRPVSPGAGERVISIDGSKPPPAWVAYSSQFRAEIADIVVIESRDYVTSKGNASIRMMLTGQPGLTVVQAGSWIIDEVTDDKGRSLKTDAKPPRFGNEQPEPEPGESRDSVWFSSRDRNYDMMYPRSDVAIAVPGADASRIAHLKARIRVTFPGREVMETRKVEDLRENGEIRIGEATVTIIKAEKQGQQFSVQYRLGGRYQGQPALEPLDAKGQNLNNMGGGSSGGGGGQWNVSWFLRGEDVAQIRVRAYVGHRTIEVPVEMKDIPLPKGE